MTSTDLSWLLLIVMLLSSGGVFALALSISMKLKREGEL